MVAPAIVVAAPSSGSGKTTIATGIMAALVARGHSVAPFKVGPDYIDPGYHALATGRPGRNLDPNLVGTSRIAPLYAHGARGAEVAVVEGVMGLFDGRVRDDDPAPADLAVGSTAHVAGLIGSPVVLVVDVRGFSQSLAALVRGYATHDPGTHLAGVILNKVGSSRHVAIATAACESVGVPVLGAIPRDDSLAVPSRHLGLVTTEEFAAESRAAVERMGEVVAAHVDLDRLRALASTSVEDGVVWDPSVETGGRGTPVTIAVASGPAFSFAYAEHAELLAAAGATVSSFDPLSEGLPEGAAGVVIPGGFPEEHAARLAANTALRSDLAARCADGMPVHAECAGLLYLCRELVDREGVAHVMAGVLPVRAEFGARLVLGYREAVALTDSPLFAAGQRVVGHEFHRTAIVAGAEECEPAWGWRSVDGTTRREGAVRRSIHASYLHTHPAGHPGAVVRFVDAARNWASGAPSIGSQA